MHGDVGGQNRDHDRLPDIAFSWMVKEAVADGLALLRSGDATASWSGSTFADDLPADRALG